MASADLSNVIGIRPTSNGGSDNEVDMRGHLNSSRLFLGGSLISSSVSSKNDFY